MTMSKKKDTKVPRVQNFVAKHAGMVNRAEWHQDQTKYNRKSKHRKPPGNDAFFMLDISVSLSL